MADFTPDGRIRVGDKATSPGAEMRTATQMFDDAWWRDHYPELEGLEADRSFDHYEPAFHYGWDSAHRHPGRRFEDVEDEVGRGWEERRGNVGAPWAEMRQAVHHAFDRAMKVFEGIDPKKR